MSDFQSTLPTLLPDIMLSPRLYPHQIDAQRDAALLIDADADFYKNAIFLDQRALNPNSKGSVVPLDVLWQHVDAGSSAEKAPANFIFHVGNCGSTLISRLLDEHHNVLGLREPLLLRMLAVQLSANNNCQDQAFSEIFKRSYQLLVRRFSSQQQVIIKATSMCNNLAVPLLQQNDANRGVALYVTLEVYLANMLDKPGNSVIDHFLAHRLLNLKSLVPDLNLDLDSLSRPEKIAFNWLAEYVQLIQLTRGSFANRVLLVDFDEVLAQTAVQLEIIFHHFSIPATQQIMDKALKSPLFNSYSKQPDFAYSATNREGILNESKLTNRNAIKQAMTFIENLASTHPVLGSLYGERPSD